MQEQPHPYLSHADSTRDIKDWKLYVALVKVEPSALADRLQEVADEPVARVGIEQLEKSGIDEGTEP